MTKAQLRKRWKDADFIESLSIPRGRLPNENEIQDTDLRGISKLGNAEPLCHFKFHDVKSSGVNLSHGDGALIAYKSEITNLECIDFKFDRASSFIGTTFINSDFSHSRLRLDVADCEFINCRFNDSSFAGGSNEYGFIRSKFTQCDFTSIRWKRTYFKACTMSECDMTHSQIINGSILSLKHFKCVNFSRMIFIGEDEPRLINLEDNKSE